MLSIVANDQGRQDVSTTASDGRRESEMVEGVQEEVEEEEDEDRHSVDARLEGCAQHRRGIDLDHHRFRNSSIGHARGRAPERAGEQRTPEQALPRGQRIKVTGPRTRRSRSRRRTGPRSG